MLLYTNDVIDILPSPIRNYQPFDINIDVKMLLYQMYDVIGIDAMPSVFVMLHQFSVT